MYKRYLPIPILIILFLLSITPVYASPSLSLGSTASYDLTGSVQASETCTASPATYEPEACYGAYYSPPETATVSILDDSQCQSLYNSRLPVLCRFAPTYINLPQGSTVTWTNEGNSTHSVTANQTVNGSPLFNSGPISPKGAYSFTFPDVGTFDYYDSIYDHSVYGRSGTVNIISAVSSITNRPPMSISVGLTGSLGWKTIGLSSSRANLLVSHTTSLTLSPSVLISFTPVSESGSFEQSIDLSTRVESPGTSSSLVLSALAAYVPAISQIFAGTGQFGTPQVSPGSLIAEPSYTQWWINGPLANGSPVQILQGWSSVTGSGGIDIGNSIGTRQAWIVTSNVNQTFTLHIPNVNNPLGPSSTSTAKANIGFQWSFDKSTDLLLKNNDTIKFSTLSVSPTTVYLGTGTADATVTRTMSVTATLKLQLSSTSLISSAQQSPNLNPIAPTSWMSIGLVGLAAGVISAALLWQGYRTRRSAGPVSTPTGPTPY